MSATGLYKEVQERLQKSKHFHSRSKMERTLGNHGEATKYLDLATKEDDINRDWFRIILKTRPDEVCALLRSKDALAGTGNIPFAKREPSYPDILSMLGLIADYELEKYLTPECMSRYKRIR